MRIKHTYNPSITKQLPIFVRYRYIPRYTKPIHVLKFPQRPRFSRTPETSHDQGPRRRGHCTRISCGICRDLVHLGGTRPERLLLLHCSVYTAPHPGHSHTYLLTQSPLLGKTWLMRAAKEKSSLSPPLSPSLSLFSGTLFKGLGWPRREVNSSGETEKCLPLSLSLDVAAAELACDDDDRRPLTPLPAFPRHLSLSLLSLSLSLSHSLSLFPHICRNKVKRESDDIFAPLFRL